MRVYVATSRRNQLQEKVVKLLREAGHEVYDFKHPAPDQPGFSWAEVDPSWQGWTPEKYALNHPAAKRGFARDMSALDDCDAVIVVLPCGRSAHVEAGYAQGRDKIVGVLLDNQSEAELLYSMFDRLFTNTDQIVEYLALIEAELRDPLACPCEKVGGAH